MVKPPLKPQVSRSSRSSKRLFTCHEKTSITERWSLGKSVEHGKHHGKPSINWENQWAFHTRAMLDMLDYLRVTQKKSSGQNHRNTSANFTVFRNIPCWEHRVCCRKPSHVVFKLVLKANYMT